MRVAFCLMGRELVAVEVNEPAEDNGTDPGDVTTSPVGFTSSGVWERPSIPALELDL